MKRPPQPALVKKGKSDRWLVDLRCFNGGRQYFKDEASALRAWRGAISDQAAFGDLAFQLSHKERTRYLALESRLAAIGTTLEEVVAYWERTHRPAAEKRLGEAIAECLAVKLNANKRPRYMEQLGYALESFKLSAGENKLCSELSLADVERWLANPVQPKSGRPTTWGPRTRQGKLVDVRTFFAFAKKRKWITANPAHDAEPILVDAQRPGILTVPQVRRLFDVCREIEPDLMPWLVLGIFCGVRPDEIKRLTWDLVSIDRALVDVPPEISKVRRRARFIPVQPNALTWLKLKGDLPPTNWRRRWQRVRIKAGFKIRKKAKKGELWPHDAMRHTFCSYTMPIFGASKTADWHGDDEATMIDHYRERVTESSAREFWAIAP